MSTRAKKPGIRFAGFEDEWAKKKFDDVFDMLSNNTLSRDALNSENGAAKNIHYGDVLTKFGEYLDVSSAKLPFISDPAIATKFVRSYLKDGDIVIADTAEDETVGKCTEVIGVEETPVIAGLHTMPCRPKEKYAPKYMGYYLNSNAYHDNLFPLMQGVKVTSISRTGVKETEVILSTNFEEQEKIGEHLSSLDNMIALETAKHEKLIIIKKAMLEKMFPKEGCDVPELRFGDYTGAWEQRKLSEFGQATGGTSIESEFSEVGIYKVISIGSYSEDSIYRDQGIRAVRSDKTENRILNKGDITMILNDKTASGNIIGRVLLIEESGVYVYNQRTERIEVDRSNYDSQFIYTMLNAPDIRDKIIKQSQGNTQIYINWKTVSQTDYLVPQINEQRKIGEYFSNLNHLITLHQRRLKKLKNIKSACMEKMFV